MEEAVGGSTVGYQQGHQSSLGPSWWWWRFTHTWDSATVTTSQMVLQWPPSLKVPCLWGSHGPSGWSIGWDLGDYSYHLLHAPLGYFTGWEHHLLDYHCLQLQYIWLQPLSLGGTMWICGQAISAEGSHQCMGKACHKLPMDILAPLHITGMYCSPVWTVIVTVPLMDSFTETWSRAWTCV